MDDVTLSERAKSIFANMKTTISSQGRIVLPTEIRRQDGIRTGQEFEVERIDRGEYRLKRRSSGPNDGVVAWLLACPEKMFFVPIEAERRGRVRQRKA